MYRYNISKTKLVIIPLDGTVFDLNRYRYNYYHHICDDKHIPFNKHDFYRSLSNMYDMYKVLPLENKVDVGPLNAKIERELSQYLTNKGMKPKEGLQELIEYLHQKDIKIAIISTHRTKDAVSYLQQSKLYNKVHFIIGSDTVSLPLPSTQMLETITQHFEVKNEETLVISSFMSLNHAANQLHMGVIYCEDLVKADLDEKETSYKIVSNLFEVLNTFLFDKYENVEIYSPILGMNEHMSKEQLDDIHDHLQETYQDDHQIMELVNQTYEYHLSQLQPKDESLDTKTKGRYFTFENSIEESVEDHKEVLEAVQEDILEPEENSDESKLIRVNPLSTQDEEDLTALLKQINKKEEPKESTIKKVTDYNEIEKIVKEAQPQVKEDESSFLSFVVNFLYVLAISFLILFIGIIIYIAFIHQFEVNEGLFAVVNSLYHAYYSFIEIIFSSVLNGLHSFISFIPDYQHYETANALFSADGIKLLNIFLFQSILIGVIKMIISIFRKDSNDEIDD